MDEPRTAVSACIVTLDEEDRLPDCLASLEWCDEVVVIDSHSSDRTREIAAASVARVRDVRDGLRADARQHLERDRDAALRDVG